MNFNERVYNLCKKVPKGRVTTYGEIGKALEGRGQIYRAVGRALNVNRLSFSENLRDERSEVEYAYAPKVPCHRVVSSDGSIGGFAKGVKKKIEMLKKEGIKIVDNKIVDFEKIVFKFRKR